MLSDQTTKLFEDGGLNQQGGTNQVDEISGNDVPVGAMKEEVRDDIDAKLSEGEFVFPADVVRYIGLEKLMMMRDKAKSGLQRMEEIGQMGNADQVENPEALHSAEQPQVEGDEEFSSAVDQAMMDVDKQGFATGGYVEMADGGVPSITQQAGTGTPLTRFSMKTFTNSAGQTLYIPFLGTEPLLQIPEGYTQGGGASTTTPTAPTADAGGGTTGGGAPDTTGGMGGGISGGGQDSAGTWGSMSASQQAAFYADNPAFSTATTALQGLFGLTSLGKAQAALDPALVAEQSMIARGIDPSTFGAEAAPDMSTYDADNEANIASAEAAIAAENANVAGANSEASHDQDGNNSGSLGSAGVAGGGLGGAGGAAGDGGGLGYGGDGSDGGYWQKGGFVSKKRQKTKQKSLGSKK